MNSFFSRASLKRLPRTRTRKNATFADNDSPSCSSVLVRRKTRPPPLQIIPELSENELDLDVSPTRSPATARPSQFLPQQPEPDSSRITLSAYKFSIDDALFMFGDDTPHSPALSASSSISDGVSSEDVLVTPGTSDDEDRYDFTLPTPRICPQRVTIRPLCIVKARSLICQENEDIHNYFENAEEKALLPVTGQPFEHSTQANVATEAAQEAEQDFYTQEFEDFISLSPVVSSPTSPARRDSLTLTAEVLPSPVEVPELKHRGRSRHSKPLPLPPPVTPPFSSFPFIPTFPLVQTTAQKSVVRRKRNMPPLSCYPPSPPAESRPLPRMTVPLDIEDCIFSDEDVDVPSRGPIVIEQVYDAREDPSIYSQSSFACPTSLSTHPLPPAIAETPSFAMYGEVILPRSSTDSDAPRSSMDSTSSFASSTTPASPFSFPRSPSSEGHEPEFTQRLCSRWSSSTLASLAPDPPRSTTFLSPLRSVFGSRVRRVPPQKAPPQIPPYVTPPRFPKSKRGVPTISASPPGKHIRQQGSRSSTSSGGTSSSECDSRDVSPSGLKRKPIPITMFLRI